MFFLCLFHMKRWYVYNFTFCFVHSMLSQTCRDRQLFLFLGAPRETSGVILRSLGQGGSCPCPLATCRSRSLAERGLGVWLAHRAPAPSPSLGSFLEVCSAHGDVVTGRGQHVLQDQSLMHLLQSALCPVQGTGGGSFPNCCLPG